MAWWAARSPRRRTKVPADQAPAHSTQGKKSQGSPSGLAIWEITVKARVAAPVATATRPRTLVAALNSTITSGRSATCGENGPVLTNDMTRLPAHDTTATTPG